MSPQCLHAVGVAQPRRVSVLHYFCDRDNFLELLTLQVPLIQQVRPTDATTSHDTDPSNADALDAAFKGITAQVIVSIVVLAIFWNAETSCDLFQLKVWAAVFTVSPSCHFCILSSLVIDHRFPCVIHSCRVTRLCMHPSPTTCWRIVGGWKNTAKLTPG